MENKKKKLSIIVPHKNDSVRLIRLISSIPKRDDFEIIIVDDHSESFSELENELKVYPTVNLFQNLTNIRSAGKARNIGLIHAKGDWILFADSDDYFLNNFEESFEQYSKSGVDSIYFRPDFPNNHPVGSIDKMFNWYNENPSSENELRIKLNSTAPWSKLISRDYLEKNSIKFDETIKSNDQIFSQKQAICTNNVKIDNTPIYHFEVHEGGITMNKSPEAFISSVEVFSRSYKLLSDNFSKQKLLKVTPEIFYFPFKFILESLLLYKNLNMTKKIIKLYTTNSNWKPTLSYLLLAIKARKEKKKIFR